MTDASVQPMTPDTPLIPRSAAEGIVWPAVPEASDAIVLSLLHQLEQIEWWPPDVLRHHQFAQAERLIAHAFDTVPFYRDRLKDVVRLPVGGLTDEAWRSIPVFTRQEAQANEDVLLSRRVRRRAATWRVAAPAAPRLGRSRSRPRGWRAPSSTPSPCGACSGTSGISLPGGTGRGAATARRDGDELGAGVPDRSLRAAVHAEHDGRAASAAATREARLLSHPAVDPEGPAAALRRDGRADRLIAWCGYVLRARRCRLARALPPRVGRRPGGRLFGFEIGSIARSARTTRTTTCIRRP